MAKKKQKTIAVDKVSFEVEKGEFVARKNGNNNKYNV